MPSTPLIDLDVHNELPSEQALYPYLSAGWLDYVGGSANAGAIGHGYFPPVNPTFRTFAYNLSGGVRIDSIGKNGEPPGSDPQLMIDQLLDPFNVVHVILTGGVLAFGVATISNPYFAQELARATNDHLVDNWLANDSRFQGSIILPLQVPEWAAQEIYRHADNPRMVQVITAANPLPCAFGHPLFDPVHKACAETGRPFAIHSLGDGAAGAAGSPLGAGWPSFHIEHDAGAFQAIATHLMSFIYHGVFERYPDFRLVLVEAGISWIPSVLHRMDTGFKGLRREVPWCRRLPSEYFLERVTVSTQPFDVTGKDDPLLEGLERLGAFDSLAFASDYPHWDTDQPPHVIGLLPASWREKVLYRNAARLYGLELPIAA